MTTASPRDRILRAFWHRSRRTYVPLLPHEIEARVQPISPAALKRGIQQLAADGLIKGRRTKQNDIGTYYEITEAGRDEVAKLVGRVAA